MQTQKFGIMSPVLGLQKDFPTIFLNKAYLPDMENAMFKNGEIHRTKSRMADILDSSGAPLQTPDTYPVTGFHRFVERSTGTEYLFLFTKAHIYWWNASTKTLVLRFTCSSDCESWQSISYNDQIIATNNVDKVIKSNGTEDFTPLDKSITPTITASTIAFHENTPSADTITDSGNGFVTADFKAGDSITVSGSSSNNGTYTIATVVAGTITLTEADDLADESAGATVTITSSTVHYYGIEYATGKYLTKAKFITSYENYIILGYTTEDATIYPQRIRWNDLAQETAWKSGDAGSAQVGKEDFLTGFGHYQNLLIIFKEQSYYKLWLVGSTDIFNIAEVSGKIGTTSPHAIINDTEGNLFFLASDATIKRIDGTELSKPIDSLVRRIRVNPALVSQIRAIYNEEEAQIWWAIPQATDATGNDSVLAYGEGKWSKQKCSLCAFGAYRRQESYVWNTIPYATWNSIGWDRWDTTRDDAGYNIDIGSDYSGYVFALHAKEGTNTGYFVLSTDLADKSTLHVYKRLLSIQTYFRRETTGTATIEIKRDEEPSWQTAGTIALGGTNNIIVSECHMDMRAKTFLIKISASTRFRFLGCILGFLPLAER